MTSRPPLTGEKCSNCSVILCTQQQELQEHQQIIATTTASVSTEGGRTSSIVIESPGVVVEDDPSVQLKETRLSTTTTTTKVVSFVLDLNGEYKTVNVAGALTEIFYLEWLFSDSTAADSNQILRNNLVLCDACLFVFSKLCKYFYEFQLLRKFDSLLTESLTKCKDLLISFSASRRAVGSGQQQQQQQQQELEEEEQQQQQNPQQQQQFDMEGHNFRVHEGTPHVQISTNPPTFINPFPHFLTTAETYTAQPGGADGKTVATYQIGFQTCPPQNVGQNFDPAAPRFATIELHTPQPAAYVTAQPASSESQQTVSYGWDKSGSGNDGDRSEYLENSVSKCPDCNAEFSSTIALGLHRFRAHNYNRKYTCKTCKKGFANARNLKQHMLRHLNIRPFRCHCESTFKTKPDLQAHQRLVHSVEDRQRIKERLKRNNSWRKTGAKPSGGGTVVEPDEFKCVDCGQVYTTPSALGDHRIKIHHTNQVYKCHYCGENFSHARSLKVHMTRHSTTNIVPDPPKPPPQRGKKKQQQQQQQTNQNTASRMQTSSYVQTNTVTYQPQQPNQRNVKQTQQTQTQTYGFDAGMPVGHVTPETWSEPPKPSKRSGNYIPKCYHCNIEFESAISLGLHRFRFHNTGRKNVCEICNKGFANARNLKDHMFRHLNIRPFKCESCDMSFKTKQDLSNHNLYLHSAESKDRRQQMAQRRTFLLTTGQAAADGSGGQQQQQQQQVLQASSSCDSPSSENTMGSNISNAGSPQAAKLNSDSLVFKCTDCQEEFSSAPNLGDHRAQVHQAADLFKCHVCSKSFVNGNGLKEHMKRHTDARNFRCELCGSGFKVKLDLKQHHYLVHTEDGRRRLHENYARSRAKKQAQQVQKEAADAAALLEVTWSDDETSEINVEDQETSAQHV